MSEDKWVVSGNHVCIPYAGLRKMLKHGQQCISTVPPGMQCKQVQCDVNGKHAVIAVTDGKGYSYFTVYEKDYFSNYVCVSIATSVDGIGEIAISQDGVYVALAMVVDNKHILQVFKTNGIAGTYLSVIKLTPTGLNTDTPVELDFRKRPKGWFSYDTILNIYSKTLFDKVVL